MNRSAKSTGYFGCGPLAALYYYSIKPFFLGEFFRFQLRSGSSIRLRRLAALFFIALSLTGCASSGQLKYEGKSYNFNRSAIIKEKDGYYRVWIWSYERGLLEFFGSSSAGIQMLMPEKLKTGASCDIEKDCKLWVRGYWYLAGSLMNNLWIPAGSGIINISSWETKTPAIAGTFQAQTKKGPVSGVFEATHPYPVQWHTGQESPLY